MDAFTQGYKSAAARGQTGWAATFLWGVGNCDFVRHRYQSAITSFLAAREIYESRGDSSETSTLYVALASAYQQVGDNDAAIDAATRALTGLHPVEPYGQRAKRILILADLQAQRGDWEQAQKLFAEAIIEAERIDDPELLSNTWAHFGSELLSRKQLSQAEEALLEAYRIRKLNRLPTISGSYKNLGLMRLEQGDLRSAAALLDTSVAESKLDRGRIPQWRFYQARGRLRLAQRKLRQAHEDLRLALELARNYRLAVPSSDSTRLSLEAALQQQLYAWFVETGTQLYLNRSSARESDRAVRAELACETFEAVEENRAGSLGVRLGERKQFYRKLPPSYWEQLAELQSAESAALIKGGERPRQAMRRLRSSLIELEIKAGLDEVSSLRGGLLDRVQRKLDSGSVLLSFHLATPASWLWAVDKTSLSLYRLPGQAIILDQARRFRQALLTRSTEAEGQARELYQMLFGALGRRYRNRSRWLLSLDHGLFDVPFPALVAGEERQAPVYLIERHSVRIISSAALWSAAPKHPRRDGAFVGVGDAIYNTADKRWRGRSPARTPGWFEWQLAWPILCRGRACSTWTVSAAAPPTMGLSRLPGSAAEIAACAREWRGSSALLTGGDATAANVRRALESGPAVMHFAAHVLQRPELSDAMIALSISEAGQDELLGPSEIGAWSVDPGLVVLSGCGSGAAVARPGAGLMGMTRAWLMAGAHAVVATGWSIPDDVGVFFGRFYRQLDRSQAHDPADALQVAQIETLRSGGWRSRPGFWAAYFALGND